MNMAYLEIQLCHFTLGIFYSFIEVQITQARTNEFKVYGSVLFKISLNYITNIHLRLYWQISKLTASMLFSFLGIKWARSLSLSLD